MLRYFCKRLVVLLPVLLITAVAAFILTTSNTKDIIDTRILNTESDYFTHYKILYTEEYNELGYNKPLFYFNIESALLPDTLYKIADDLERSHIAYLCFKYKNKTDVMVWIKTLKKWQMDCISGGINDNTNNIKWINNYNVADSLLYANDVKFKFEQVIQADNNLLRDTTFKKIYNYAQFFIINNNHYTYLQYIPLFKWNGAQCRFHNWFKGVITGSFGRSYVDNRNVSTKISESLPITLIISGTSLIVLFVLGICLGIVHSQNKDKWVGRFIQPLLFLLHSIPNYTIAMWSIILFCCSGLLCWLPSGGLGDDTLTLFERIPYIILPVLCWVIPLLSVIAMHTSAAHSHAMQSPYILTSRAKGLSYYSLLKHTIRPTLVPIIALAGLIVPAALSGSVLIETIFSIPGIGKMSYEALLSRDVPVVLAITIISVTLTVIVQLVTDLLLYIVDPRIRHTAT